MASNCCFTSFIGLGIAAFIYFPNPTETRMIIAIIVAVLGLIIGIVWEIFPYFIEWVNNIKKAEGYKKVSSIGQTAEANIFVNVYQSINPEILALIIHDCILTTKENTIEIKELLMNKVKELYPEVIKRETDLNNLFKIDIVSLRDEELTSYQENEFSKNEIGGLNNENNLLCGQVPLLP